MAVFSAIIRQLNQRGFDPSPYQRANRSSAKKPAPGVNRRGGADFAFFAAFSAAACIFEREQSDGEEAFLRAQRYSTLTKLSVSSRECRPGS